MTCKCEQSEMLLAMINNNSDNSCHLYMEHLLYVSLYIHYVSKCFIFTMFDSQSNPGKDIVTQIPISQMRKQRLGEAK